ncbi:hypothetical protein F4801DRAFT_594639 [Xylaria longipes]|nr:hypothetical protein F4801DRAFT_594639 [Xylaria longipes]RYC59112.1 hypothetical protein CHU98_g7115 [Xylaria longipes]
MRIPSYYLSLFVLPAASAASPPSVKRGPPASFGLFAYGTGIGGFPLFSDGDTAYVGDGSQLNNTNSAPVTFTAGTDNSLIGSPNTTDSTATPSWSNITFYIPNSGSSSHKVGFTNSTVPNNASSTGFVFYGQVVLHESDEVKLESGWYAVATGTDNVWSLEWNTTSNETSDGRVAVTLKTTRPTTPAS